MLDEKPQYESGIELTAMCFADLPEIVRLYQEVFYDHFLGHMGGKFLRLFCAQFINSSANQGYVAKSNGRPVGFVLGSIEREPFARFYRQNFWLLVILVTLRYFRDAYVRKHISQRLGCIAAALQAFFLRRQGEGESKGERDRFAPARILAIGVRSDYRGRGVANLLTKHFCAKMKQVGYKKVGLSTLPTNQRAIHFYKKDGWIIEESTPVSLSFIRTIV
ncbi:GNAT family N-acetyltransferase [Desulfosporosinus sp. PR]|uniref:GNAT family N-acetyltransferase n=1 Tax=Candidatus Desulfosporosinus nitrosoreducens TaxID=3401928 RepID=UPI0027E7D6F4|nr:GNAT family N-acetyltransferase [Desulfosporosinus sp. PR]MDQ7095567.1 GNAT family N-acetyltransferase [Desulfosporosinus sp. PR]